MSEISEVHGSFFGPTTEHGYIVMGRVFKSHKWCITVRQESKTYHDNESYTFITCQKSIYFSNQERAAKEFEKLRTALHNLFPVGIRES